ncbi:zinc finger protein 91-like isoform X1 [Ochlerotatus camptorhynchus]|uniref:zinc finger protein 91-like isoform X1 n=1 Tax=Ochlerotatus camptorhynchus TaxID=644619 RepID=UPI0031CDAFC7
MSKSPLDIQAKMVECGICSEDYKEGDLELHREMCVVRLMFRCSLCDGDYVSKEGLWNHLDLHEIADESKELHHQEIKAKHKLHQCVLCNDQRAYSESPYWKHIHDIHDGFFLRCSDCGENFRSESLQNDHALSQCMARKQTEDGQVPIEVENMTSDAGHSKLKQKKKSSNENKVPSMRLRVRPSHKSSDELILNDRSDPTVVAKISSSEASCTKCSHCGIEESSAVTLTHHILNHHETVACDFCGHNFSSLSQAQHHMTTLHKKSTLKCPHCSMQYTWRVSFQRHVFECEKKKLLCEGCGAIFKDKDAIRRHKKNCCRAYKWCKEQEQTSLPLVKSGLSQTKCGYCNEDFSSPGHLIRHLQIVHKLTKCDICGLTILGISVIKNHKIKFHTEPKYECPTCGTKFSRKKKYDAHCLLCKQGMYSCKLCGHMFRRLGSLKRHDKQFHPDESSLENRRSGQVQVQRNKRYLCKVCGCSFAHFRSAKRHNKRCHPDGCNLKNIGIAQDQKQVQPNNLQMARDHQGPSTDNRSSKMGVSNSRSNEHSSACLNDDDFMESQVIDKESRMVSEKTSQVLVDNSSIQAYSDNIIDITLSSYRQNHMLNKHTEGKFQCPHCSRNFFFKRCFECHTSSCADLKHSCELCGQKFNLLSIVENHKKRVHCGDGPLGNACIICKIAFANTDELMKHKPACSKQAKMHDDCQFGAEEISLLHGGKEAQNNDLDLDIKVEETVLHEQEYQVPNEDPRRSSVPSVHSHGHTSKDIEAEDLESGIKVNEEYPEDAEEIQTEHQSTTKSSKCHEVPSDRNETLDAGDKLWPCSICGHTFKRNHNLRYHKLVSHTEPRYKCNVCQKSFHIVSFLRRHLSSCSKIRCDKCGLKFTTRRHLCKQSL